MNSLEEHEHRINSGSKCLNASNVRTWHTKLVQSVGGRNKYLFYWLYKNYYYIKLTILMICHMMATYSKHTINLEVTFKQRRISKQHSKCVQVNT